MPLPAAIRDQLDSINFEAEVLAFRDAVLGQALQGNLRVEVAAAALADVLAIMAGQLDEERGGFTLPDRLHVFCARVEASYRRRRNLHNLGAGI